MGSIAQIYNIDTIDPEKKAKAIKYYESINPNNVIRVSTGKDKQIQTYISTYQSSNTQSAAFTQARIDRADAAKKTSKEHNEPILQKAKERNEKLDYVERKELAEKQKTERTEKAKN